jgi:hypothetical protein
MYHVKIKGDSMQLYKLVSFRPVEFLIVVVGVLLWSLLRQSIVDGLVMLIVVYAVTTIMRWDQWNKDKTLMLDNSVISRLWRSAHSKK